MMAAGSLSNLLTGGVALLIALRDGAALPLPVTGSIALLGAWSFGLAAANLLPFCTPQGYSDGAIVLQLIAGGAFADFHLSVARIGSSLVSSLRPRDYDIGSIRAPHAALPMAVMRCCCGCMPSATRLTLARRRKQTRCSPRPSWSACNPLQTFRPNCIPPLCLAMRLCAAIPVATRFWWNRMQAKKAYALQCRLLESRERPALD